MNEIILTVILQILINKYSDVIHDSSAPGPAGAVNNHIICIDM